MTKTILGRLVIEKVSVKFSIFGVFCNLFFVSYDLPVEFIVSRDPKYLSVLYEVSLVSSPLCSWKS